MRSFLWVLCAAALSACAAGPGESDVGSGPDSAGDSGACGADGDRCDADGDGCTRDVCEGGRCVAGELRGCDDGDACTDDRCVSTGNVTFDCINEVSDRTCTIEGMCVADGTMNPDNACEVCETMASRSQWTLSTAACDDENVCTTGDRCMEGVCVGVAPIDEYEDNDTSATATVLEPTTDGSDYPQGTVEALLFPDDDEDFYSFVDSDEFGSLIYPRIQLSGIPADADFDLCAFITCTVGDDGEAVCAEGTNARFEDMSGCCSNVEGNGDEDVRISPGCTGSDDSVRVLVRVRRVGGEPTCNEPYTLQYGDD